MKYGITLLFLLYVIHGSDAQTTFEKIYGQGVDTYGYSVIEASDGGYVVLGGTMSGVLRSIFLFRTDVYGDTIWSRLYSGDAETDGDHAIVETSDGGFICCGMLHDSAYLLNIDNNGDSLWGKTLLPGTLNAIEHTNDGGYIGCGKTPDNGILLIKLDNGCNIQWSKGLNDQDPYDLLLSYSIKQTLDSGYIISGYWESFYPQSQTAALLVRTHQNGDTVWLKVYDFMDGSEGFSVSLTDDGGFFLCGQKSGIGIDAMAMRLNELGDTLWTRSLSGIGEQSFYSGEPMSNGGFIVCGVTQDPDLLSKALLLRYSDGGDSLWSRTYKLMLETWGFSVRSTADAGFIITGATRQSIFGKTSLGLIKTDSLGLFTAVTPAPSNLTFSLYPNPATNRVTVQLPSDLTIEFYWVVNMFGQRMLGDRVDNLTGLKEIDVSGLPQGIYLVCLVDVDGRILTSKQVIGP